ncbi:hypothetical protein F383_17680 [Gossypium arboreum]|uniref:Uncharacterized protein n=1 Tax=Gossypium arboreum TaxID=29729 RepID=A0A0B0NTI1_GOSAR|nr:hypothetical protein F383_17680 [Gossypium arboreum]
MPWPYLHITYRSHISYYYSYLLIAYILKFNHIYLLINLPQTI